MRFKLIFLFFFFIGNAYCIDVVSTSPAITEMVAQLGFEKSIVGRTPYCQDALRAQVIGTALTPDYEKILALKPDIVFLQENSKGEVSENLKRLGIKYLSLKIVSLSDLFESWRKVANALKATDQKISELESRIKKLRIETKVMFILGGTAPKNIMAAGSNTFYDELATSLGLVNVVKTSGWPVYDSEKTRSLIDSDTLVFQFATSEERLWNKAQWNQFCPKCNFMPVADVRLTYPGPLMVEHFLNLMDTRK